MRQLSQFIRSSQGFAATEFALIAPVMLVIFFGIIEASGALTSARRVNVAANAMADLISQETEISSDQLDDLFTGVTQTLSKTTSGVVYRIVSISYDADDEKVIVDWSRDSNGGTPYTAGDPYSGADAAVVAATETALVVVEVTAIHTPVLSGFFSPKSKYAASASRLPRRAVRVDYCGTTCS